jgi:hypothetical protein
VTAKEKLKHLVENKGFQYFENKRHPLIKPGIFRNVLKTPAGTWTQRVYPENPDVVEVYDNIGRLRNITPLTF